MRFGARGRYACAHLRRVESNARCSRGGSAAARQVSCPPHSKGYASPADLARTLAEIAAAASFGEMKRRHEEGHDGMAGAALRHAGEAGHFRSGVAGDWRGHFSAAQRSRFESDATVGARDE